MQTGKVYFRNLDSIRFIAAMMVFLAHTIHKAYAYLGIDGTILLTFLKVISSGNTGVSIFFVLSGFLITYLLISEHEASGGISVKKFYIRRVLRIWPLYFAIVFFSFFIYPFLKGFSHVPDHTGQANILYYLTFLSNFDVIRVENHFTGQDVLSKNITWSVSIEEQFYLFWPLLLAFLPRRIWIYAISGVILSSLVFRIANNNDANVLYFSTFSVLMDLGIGGLFAYLIKSHQSVRHFFESASTGRHLLFFSTCFLLLMCKDMVLTFMYAPAVARIFFSVSFALIISAQAMTQKNSPLNLGRLSFANKWGKYTYGIYLIHPAVIRVLDILIRATHHAADNPATIVVLTVLAFPLTLLLSWISYEYFESRFLALKQKFEIIKTQ